MPEPVETVLVTSLEYGKGATLFADAKDLRVLEGPASEAALATRVRETGCRAVIVGTLSYGEALCAALSEASGGKGAAIVRMGVGCDAVDRAALARHAVLLANTPGLLDQSVAEHALFLLGALSRRIAELDAAMKAGRFDGARSGIELRGRTLGLIGFGAIGRRLARMASLGLGMCVLAADVRPLVEMAAAEGRAPEDFLREYGAAECTTDAESVLRRSDAVSLHLAAVPATRGWMNAERFARMRAGAFLVNTARGSLLDEIALFDALSSGHLGGAALDVFREEPYVPAHPSKDLRTLPNVVLTPHVASNTIESNRRMAEFALANVRHFLAGRPDRMTLVR